MDAERFEVTYDTNFCHVLELPTTWPSGYCFAGPVRVEAGMVDWFEPVPPDWFQGGKCVLEGQKLAEHRALLIRHVAEKPYIQAGRRYVIVTDYGDIIVIPRKD